MKKLRDRYLPQGSAIRHVSTLVSGATLGQLAVLLASPILTRLYTPEEFGILAIYASLLSIIGVVAGLRYELAIPLARTNGSAANILALTVLCVISTTTLALIFIALFDEQIPVWINTPAIAPYLWLLPLGILLAGLYQTFNYWAIRHHSFNRIARTKIQQGVGGALAQVGMGFAHLGPFGLIVGQIIGQSAGLVELIRGAYRQDLSLMPRIRWRRIRQRARRYQRFPKYTTWAALANSGSTMLPPVMFAAMFSLEIAGIYMLAHRTLQVPLSLIGSSIGQVFHIKAAEAWRNGTLDQLMLKSFKGLLRISLIPLVVIAYFAPDLFALVFGESWRQAGTYVQWMVPWIIIQFIVSPTSIIVSVTENQFGGLISQILFLVVRLFSIVIGANVGGSDGAVFYYSMSGVIVYFGLWLWMMNIVGIGFYSWVRFISRDIFIFVAIITAILLFFQ